MKPKLYIETSVISYLVARPSREVIVAGQQKLTQEFWKMRLSVFDPYISPVVVEEIREGDRSMAARREGVIKSLNILVVTEDMFELADTFVRRGAIPEKARKDAMHVAIAAIHNMNFLVTWNCRHIANALMSRRLAEIIRSRGLQPPILCTPNELMEE